MVINCNDVIAKLTDCDGQIKPELNCVISQILVQRAIDTIGLHMDISECENQWLEEYGYFNKD